MGTMKVRFIGMPVANAAPAALAGGVIKWGLAPPHRLYQHIVAGSIVQCGAPASFLCTAPSGRLIRNTERRREHPRRRSTLAQVLTSPARRSP